MHSDPVKIRWWWCSRWLSLIYHVPALQNQLEKYDSIEYALNVKYEYPFGSSKVYVNVKLQRGFQAYTTNLSCSCAGNCEIGRLKSRALKAAVM